MGVTLRLKNYLKERENFKLELEELLEFGIKELPNLTSHQRYRQLNHAIKELEAANDIYIPDTSRNQEPISKLPFFIINNRKRRSVYQELKKKQRAYIRENANWIEKLKIFNQDRFFKNEQIDHALKLNSYFLYPASLKEKVSINYRSLEIFGNESTLGKLFKSQLFSEILTAEDFNIYRVDEPLVCHDINTRLKSSIRSILICDSKESWKQCVRLNTQMRIFASIVFLNARQMAQKEYVVKGLNSKLKECNAERIYYWGSIDLSKLKFPNTANRMRKDAQSIKILPHLPLYKKLFTKGISIPKKHNCYTYNSNALYEWLGDFYLEELEDGLVIYEWPSCGLKDSDISESFSPINV